MTDTRKYVYAIGDDRNGPIKIGVSAKPKNRLRYLQTSNPLKLKIIGKFRGNEQDESALHQLLASARLTGEWFERKPALQAFNKRMVGVPIEDMGPFENSWDEFTAKLVIEAHNKQAALTMKSHTQQALPRRPLRKSRLAVIDALTLRPL